MLLDKLSCGLEVIIERYPVLKVETINNTLFVVSFGRILNDFLCISL